MAEDFSAILKRNQSGMYSVGHGLYLRVSSPKNRSWILRTTILGARKEVNLGHFPAISLARARKLADKERKRQKAAPDATPASAEKSSKKPRKAAPASPTFSEIADRHMARKCAGWSPKTSADWRQTLATYAAPAIGAMPVSEINTAAVLSIVEPIWRTKPETAARVRRRLEEVLDAAKTLGYLSGDNPARWKGHLANVLPARQSIAPTEHHAAMPYREVPAFVAKLRVSDDPAAAAMLFLLLTAARSGEVRGATWGEVDLDAAVWTIPAARMKVGREHRVPLPSPAVAVIHGMPLAASADALLFESIGGRAISSMAFHRLLIGLGYGGLTTHGFRSAFRDWAAEETDFPNEVAEMALAHAIGSKVEAAYRRGDLFGKRRALMDAWAKWCLA